MTTLNDTDLGQLTALRAQAVASQIGYWKIYEWLGDLLISKVISANHQTVLWLYESSRLTYKRLQKIGCRRQNIATKVMPCAF